MWRINVMCRILKVSKQGYFCWRDGREPPRRSADRALSVKIKAVHDQHRQVYGSPRIHRQWRSEGVLVSRKRVERLMGEADIRVLPRGRFVRTTDSNHDHPIAPNLLEQDFRASAPNQRWVTDITYISTGEGWLSLAAIIDLFSRRVVGWAMDQHMDRSLVLKALGMALKNRASAKGLIHHSDRGSPFLQVKWASEDYRQALADMGITASMSCRGNCYDKAVIESFWHSLKNELIHRQHLVSREQAKAMIFDDIEVFYNRTKLHSSLGYLSPETFEAMSARRPQEAT